MLRRQFGTVHLIGQEDLGRERLPQRNRSSERKPATLPFHFIEAREGHVPSIGSYPCGPQDLRQPHPAPARIAADGVGPPQQLPRYGRHLGQLLATVPGTLQSRRPGLLGKGLLELIQREAQWLFHHSPHRQPVALEIDLGNRPVVADEEEAVGREEALPQGIQGRARVEGLLLSNGQFLSHCRGNGQSSLPCSH